MGVIDTDAVFFSATSIIPEEEEYVNLFYRYIDILVIVVDDYFGRKEIPLSPFCEVSFNPFFFIDVPAIGFEPWHNCACVLYSCYKKNR